MLLAGQDRISAVLDFGDMVYCPRICELGVAAAYASFGCADLVHAIGLAARGYHAVLPLAAEEIRILPGLVVARYLLSVLHAAKRAREDPGNAYAQVSAGQAWNGLRCILSLDLRQVAEQIEVQLARP
jgi:Ser/Thr protein kinase RdoA (MazF antagonist)